VKNISKINRTKAMGKFLVLLLLVMLAGMAFAAATADTNFMASNQAEQAQAKLALLQNEIQKIRFSGMGTQRMNDLLLVATESYNQQIELEKNGQTPNYSLVAGKVSEALNVAKLATEAKAEIGILEQQINDTKQQNLGINLAEVMAGLENAKKELKNERYELSLNIINQTYVKLSEANSLQAKTQAVYAEAQKTIASFMQANWKTILAIIASVLVLYILLENLIKKARLRADIKKAGQELKTVQKFLKKTQEEYFEKNSLPESIYLSRSKVFTDKMRNLNREIVVMKENLAVRSMQKTRAKKSIEGEKNERKKY